MQRVNEAHRTVAGSGPGRIRRILLFLVLGILFIFPGTAHAAGKTYPYYGNKLFSGRTSAYTKIIKKLNAGNMEIEVPALLDDSQMLDLIQDDYPRLFWVRGIVGYRDRNGASSYVVIQEWSNAYKQKKAFDKAVKRAVKAVKKKCKGKSKLQQARIALDYIVQNCSYKSSKYDQTAYGVFVRKSAVCAGYARAYKILCDELGIPCICVPCHSFGTVTGLHMVNFVKVNKKWYYVDPSSADAGKTTILDVFLIGRNNSKIEVNITKAHDVKLPTLAKSDYKMSRYSGYTIYGQYTLINAYL